MSEQMPEFRSGYVAILGKPNAGKSTLLNAIVGEKIAIVSEKPQTTRDRIAGILTTTSFQIVFLDTPGVIDPRDKLNEALMARVHEALEGIDVLYHLVDVTDRDPQAGGIGALVERAKVQARFLVVNKVDKLGSPPARENIRGFDPENYDETIFISAQKRRGIDLLIDKTVERLPPGPHYYDPEQLSDRDERFLAAEIVREKVFRHFSSEIPYSVFTEVESFEERPGKDLIRIIIHVERESQKGILIGEGGRMLKKIGQESRREIERITGRPCFLELWVKVRKNWRKNPFDLSTFGFKQGRRR